MGSAQLARRAARLERAFGGRRSKAEQDRVLAELDQLRPAQRREKIQLLATQIVQRRGIKLEPGEKVESAAVRAIHGNLNGDRADTSETTGALRQSQSRIG